MKHSVDTTTRRAVLWDLDGTIVDSAEYHWQSWRKTLSQLGVALERSDFELSFGKRNDEVIRSFLGDDVAIENIERISSTKEVVYRALIAKHGLEIMPGVRQWLNYFRSSHWFQCVASSSPCKNIDAVIDELRLRQFFDCFVSAEQTTKGKPDPEIFLKAAAQVSVDPNRCIVIEDSPAGIEAASRAGMISIGVLTTHSELSADIIVASLNELSISMLQRNFYLLGRF